MKGTFEDMLVTGRNGEQSPEKAEESYDGDLRAFADIFKAAEPGAVFGAPVVAGEYTVITASEVSSAGGFGNTRGMAPSKPANAIGEEAPTTRENSPTASWSGGGGGGGSSGRPIAVIVIGPDGVKIKPVMDATKYMLAMISMWRAVLPALLKLAVVRRARKR